MLAGGDVGSKEVFDGGQASSGSSSMVPRCHLWWLSALNTAWECDGMSRRDLTDIRVLYGLGHVSHQMRNCIANLVKSLSSVCEWTDASPIKTVLGWTNSHSRRPFRHSARAQQRSQKCLKQIALAVAYRPVFVALVACQLRLGKRSLKPYFHSSFAFGAAHASSFLQPGS